MKTLIAAFLVLLIIGGIATWVVAGRAPGPVIEIPEPIVVGQTGEVAIAIETPGGELKVLDVALVQDGATYPIFTLATDAAALEPETDNRLRLVRPVGKRLYPDLKAGTATVTVAAVRPVLFGLRESATMASADIEVRLTPPQIGASSQFHYINHGGSEMVVYRVTPADAASGVRVGEHEYPGFPATGAGVATTNSGLRVAFFALLWDQDVDTPVTLFARDAIGNESAANFDHRVFAKSFRSSTIDISDDFLARVVPPILQSSADFRVDDPSNLLASYLSINRDMRAENNARIKALAAETAPEILWEGAFKQLINTAVESGFADQRTYVHNGEEIDRQVHLGFDLASTTAAPVLAANRGRVIHAGWLGIYGNCVILDHGMGLQSLYAHLSQIEVNVGDTVTTDQQLGRSGSTGLAGGDHLHFTMLLNGNAVTPVDWWSAQWVEDRIMRKIREAEGL
jgi:murein DD-endopeptidase MepM/ murein hydrolase activator NlpD